MANAPWGCFKVISRQKDAIDFRDAYSEMSLFSGFSKRFRGIASLAHTNKTYKQVQFIDALHQN